MQLNDILEENSIKAMSQKTKISEENLENLLAKKFENLKQVKTLGFISILEREYKADLSAFREEAKAYYAETGGDQSVMLGVPVVEDKKARPRFLMLIVVVLLGVATWYFFTQFDRKNLSAMIPFMDEKHETSIREDKQVKNDIEEDAGIAKVGSGVSEVTQRSVGTALIEHDIKNDVEVTQTIEDIVPQAAAKKTVLIVPVHRLWFGLVDASTKKREHFSISDTYTLDVAEQGWLVATSSAAFSLKEGDETKAFNDAKEHYFKIDANGIEVLNKSDYVALGGWPQW